jgi:hypothetical protein
VTMAPRTRQRPRAAAQLISAADRPEPPHGLQLPPESEPGGAPGGQAAPLSRDETAFVEWLAEEALRQWQAERQQG